MKHTIISAASVATVLLITGAARAAYTFGEWAAAQSPPLASDAKYVYGALPYPYTDPAITSLDGVRNYTSLQEIQLQHHALTTLPENALLGLTSLRSMNLGWNPLSTIADGAFNGMSAMVSLDLRDGQLETITAGQLSGMPNLESLYLYRNSIASIAADTFDNLPKLNRIGLAGNDISSIADGAFDGLPLKYIYLYDNTSLNRLDLSGADLSNLSDFWADDCPLTEVSLRDAILSDNAFYRLFDANVYNPSYNGGHDNLTINTLIEELDLSGAELSTVSTGKFALVKNVPSICSLNLSHATGVNGDSLVSLTGQLPNLQILNVTGVWEGLSENQQNSLLAWKGGSSGRVLIIPEPGTFALLAFAGLAGMTIFAWRRRK